MQLTSQMHAPTIQTSWHKPVSLAYLIILTTFGAGAGWATFAKLESAAIANGVVVAETNRKTIQHLEGGIVREILVKDGDRVQEGDIILKMDDTQAKANLDTIKNQINVSRIQEARLLAELHKSSKIVLPNDLADRLSEYEIKRVYDDQVRNMLQRATYIKSQVDVLDSKILQSEQELSALANDAERASQQLLTIDQELGGLRQLLAKQLVPISRVASLERERIRLQGVSERAVSDKKKVAQSIQETNLTIVQIQKQFLQQVSSDIVDVRKTLSELAEKERVANDILQRTELKAPRTGIVQASKIFTIGAVIRPGDPILEISPTGDQLTISIQISPGDIDSISEGLTAQVRFPTYHSRRVPFMFGHLKSVSYDRVTDPQDPRNFYYQGQITVDAASVPLEIKDKLKPGIPAEVIVTTGEQTPIDYFLGPLFDRLAHGLRER